MLKITKSNEFAARSEKAENKIGINSIVDDIKIINQESSTKEKNQAKITNSKNLVKSKNHEFFLNLKNIDTRLSLLIFSIY